MKKKKELKKQKQNTLHKACAVVIDHFLLSRVVSISIRPYQYEKFPLKSV